MIVFGLIALLLMIVLISGALYFLPKLGRIGTSFIWKAIIVYAVIGCIAAIFTTVYAKETPSLLSKQEINEQMQLDMQVYEWGKEGNWEELAPYKIEETTLYSETDEVEYQNNEKFFGMYVYVTYERRDSNEIIATQYMTRHITNGLDITERIEPVQLKIHNGLLISNMKQKEIETITFRPNIEALNQWGENVTYNNYIGNHILHLNVPQHMHIIDNSGWVITLSNN